MTNMKLSRLLAPLLLVLGYAVSADAATLKVCTTGCPYTTVQAAINAASAGDEILLEEGHLYVEDVTLPVKAGAGPSAILTIKTGVSSTGVTQSLSRYPSANIRICPSTFVSAPDPIDGTTMNCSTRSPQDMTRIAKIRPATNNAYAIRPVATGTGTPVSYYKFQWIEVVANAYGGNSLIGLLNDTAPFTTGTTAMLPHHFTFDQVVLRGDPATGQFRGTQLDGAYETITNSFIYDIKAQGEGQAIWVNGPGPLTFINNFVSGGTEVFFTGGSGTQPSPIYTVGSSPAPSTTSFPVDRVTDLIVSKTVAVYSNTKTVSSISATNPAVVTTGTTHGLSSGWQVKIDGLTGCNSVWFGVPFTATVLSSTTFSINANCTTTASGGTVRTRAAAEISAIVGNVLTVTPALPVAPASGDEVKSSIVLTDMTIKNNIFTRPSTDRTTPILPTPASSSAAAFTTGGTLVAGSYAYRVEARMYTAQFVTARSGAATQTNTVTTTGSTGRVDVSWASVANAVDYLVYGRTPAGQDRYWVVTAPTTTFSDTGTAGTASSVNTSPNYWQVKNTFEIKVGRNALIEFNVIENSWVWGQAGPCVLLTATQQNIDAHSAVVRDIMFRNNVIRHCVQFFQFTGRDALSHESARSGGVTFDNNLWYDASSLYGGTSSSIVSAGGGPRQYPLRSTFDFLLRHNTMAYAPATSPGATMIFSNCEDYPTGITPSNESPSDNTDMTDNIFYTGQFFGFVSIGNASPNCGVGYSNNRMGLAPNGPLGTGSVLNTNVLAGGTCSAYSTSSTNMLCPTIATLESNTFTNTTSITGFQVKVSSPYHNVATDGTDIGANIAAITPGTNIAFSGDNSGSTDVTNPTVSVTAPTNGSTVSGSSVAFTATASDNVAVTSVQFKVDGVNLGVADTVAPYSTTFDSTLSSNGTHTLSAVASDAVGNTSSSSVNVTVSNAAGSSASVRTQSYQRLFVSDATANSYSSPSFDAAGAVRLWGTTFLVAPSVTTDGTVSRPPDLSFHVKWDVAGGSIAEVSEDRNISIFKASTTAPSIMHLNTATIGGTSAVRVVDNLGMEFGNGCSSVGVSTASTGRLCYDSTTQTFQQSLNGGAFATIGSGGGGGASGYSLHFTNSGSGGVLSPADSTTYLFGEMTSGYTSASYASGKIQIPTSGTITAVAWTIFSDGGTNASTENVSLYARINDTTDTTLTTTSNWSTVTSAVSGRATVSIAVTAGQFVMLKIVTPAWATNPTGLYIRGYFIVQ